MINHHSPSHLIFNTATDQPQTEHSHKICFTARGVWTNWSQWSLCSMSCGNGKKSRTRNCEGGTECDGIDNPQSSFEEKTCNNGPCPGNCIVQ